MHVDVHVQVPTVSVYIQSFDYYITNVHEYVCTCMCGRDDMYVHVVITVFVLSSDCSEMGNTK